MLVPVRSGFLGRLRRRPRGIPVETTYEFPGLELVADVSAGQWAVERLRPWAGRGPLVGAVVPEGFEAYARIPHPADDPLQEDGTATLARELEPFTTTPQACWFALWDGFGDMGVPDRGGPPRLEAPHRRYLLYRGPLVSAAAMRSGISFHPPNLWWPQDRSWCVATDIDLPQTYVGGTEACVAALLRVPALGAARTTLGAGLDPEGRDP